MMFPEQEKINNLLQEMSVRIPSEKSPLRDTQLNMEYTEMVLKYGQFLEKWTCGEHFQFDVYLFAREYDLYPTYYFIYGRQLTAAMIQVSDETNEEFVVDNLEELGKFYGNTSDFVKYRFVIRKL